MSVQRPSAYHLDCQAHDAMHVAVSVESTTPTIPVAQLRAWVRPAPDGSKHFDFAAEGLATLKVLHGDERVGLHVRSDLVEVSSDMKASPPRRR
jgi:uncharacterized ferritin-like protein (DUF455 family)